jgi:integrase
MINSNPVLHTAKPKLPDNPPDIFTVDQLRALSLLEAARRTTPNVLPMLAIGAFAGLRDAEIKRLDWSEINLARGFIEVKGSKAKSARRRIVLSTKISLRGSALQRDEGPRCSRRI